MQNEKEWFLEQIANLTTVIRRMTPSEWAESQRYLDKSVTALPGYYSYSVTPYLKEITDLLDQRSPIREVTFMKSAQIGATVGIIENGIGYLVGEVKSSPAIMMTATDDLAKTRMDRFIMPMVNQSGLDDNIMSSDTKNVKKKGMKSQLLQWEGGGSLTVMGSNSPSKLRSVPAEVIFQDEPDSYPARIKGEGDPVSLLEARASGTYAQTVKIFRMSTPTIEETSRIYHDYLTGDQRKYFVPCPSCGKKQELKFRGFDEETGQVWGLKWEKDEDGILIRESVRYVCEHCNHEMVEGDKSYLLANGEWRPTATSIRRTKRSYHISAMYSPDSMFPWASMAEQWLEAYDDNLKIVKDHDKFQAFYNTKLGEPFSTKRKRIKAEELAAHRRQHYKMGTVPNHLAIRYGSGEIGVLTASIDVHLRKLNVAVWGWGRYNQCYLIRYEIIEGDIEDFNDPAWDRAYEIISDEYKTLDGESYYVPFTLVDQPYLSDLVESFCMSFGDTGRVVNPSVGRDRTKSNMVTKDFAFYNTAKGTPGVHIMIDNYKDMWDRRLRQFWDGQGKFHKGQFSVPADTKESHLKELVTEYKKPIQDGPTGQVKGYQWHRPGNAPNELWDLLVYGNCALDVLAYDVCTNDLELKGVDWELFWDFVHENQLFKIHE